jgi:hypothetical protein
VALVVRDIRWRLHLSSPPSRVYGFLATDAGRARFWAERSEERDGLVQLHFGSGQELIAPVLARDPPTHYSLRWFGGSEAAFDLRSDGAGGTDLDFTERNVPPEDWTRNHAAWVGVLLALKAVCDFGVDLRNHDASRNADQGYVDG